jgi:hypothetical protein
VNGHQQALLIRQNGSFYLGPLRRGGQAAHRRVE